MNSSFLNVHCIVIVFYNGILYWACWLIKKQVEDAIWAMGAYCEHVCLMCWQNNIKCKNNIKYLYSHQIFHIIICLPHIKQLLINNQVQ